MAGVNPVGLTSAPPAAQSLADKLQYHSGRVRTALGILRDIQPVDAEGSASPEPVGANGWMMECQREIEELINGLEQLRDEVGRI